MRRTEPPPRRPVILVVDDTPLNLDTLTEVLKHDYIVRPALSGALALRLARGATAPDLILLDVMMPNMDGFEVMRQLRADPDTADIPVIFVTALSEHGSEINALTLGAADYITKPFSPPVVLARVRTQLALRQAQRHLAQVNARLLAERELVEDVLVRLRATENFDSRQLRYLLSSVDRSNGDILLAAFTPDGRQRVMLGDIAGHGPAAAACAPLLGHLFYSATADNLDAHTLLDTLARVMHDRLPRQIFMTFALLELAPDRSCCEVWNGGLPGCLLLRGDEPALALPSNSLPLGLQAAGPAEDEATRLALRPQDRLYLFSDGMTEIENPQGQPLGEAAVTRLLQAFDADQPLNALVDAFAGYQGHAHFKDDLTLAELRV